MAAINAVASCKVTVVDDEPSALDVLVRAARSWRFECQAATTAEQALALLEISPTPIVVTDLRMPGRGGVWLVRQIQERWPDVAVIVVTAGREDDAVSECLHAGAHHYFLKPIKLDEFRHALEATLRSHVIQRDRERQRRQLERTLQRKTHKVRRTFLSAIDSFVRLVEARDPFLKEHSVRVRRRAVQLAEALGWDLRLKGRLSLAAKLHDIGKFGVPEAILNKPGPLTAAELHQVQQHPAIGERILKRFIRNLEILAAVRGHHERFDGGGYPDGLRGTNIPLLARLITVVDSFDAMTSRRRYREALSVPDALEVIRRDAGTAFDPELAHAFLKVAPTQVV
jgi:response regulator RpfG family c-di-GMP phosphodiesterase